MMNNFFNIKFRLLKIPTVTLFYVFALTACAGSFADKDLCAQQVLNKQNDEGIQTCSEMLDASIKKYGVEASNSIFYELLLSQAYIEKRMYTQAEPLLKHVLQSIKKNMPDKDSEITQVITDLVFVYEEQGKYNESEVLLIQSFSWFDAQLNKSIPILLELNSYLMSNYLSQDKTEQITQRINIAKNLLEKISNDHSLSKAEKERYQAETFFYQSVIHSKNERYSDALTLMQESLKWDSLSPSDNSIEIASDYMELAEIYLNLGDKNQASEYAKKSLLIIENQLGLSSSKYKKFLQRYEKIITDRRGQTPSFSIINQ